MSSNLRPARLLALSAVLAFGAVACGSDDSSSKPAATSPASPDGSAPAGGTETTAAPTDGAEPTLAALTIESGYSTGVSSLNTRYNSAGAVVTNTAGITACGVKVEFAVLDAAGAPLDTKSEELHKIAAGESLVLSTPGLGGGRDDEPASFTATITGLDSFDATGDCADSFTTSKGLTLTAADVTVDGDYILGTVTNPGDEAAEVTSVQCVLRDADGAIVGGDRGSVRGTIGLRGDAAFQIRMLWVPETATAADCTATA
jgi:hypothetical protein